VNYHLIVRPEVDADLLDAERWYDEREAGLGREFLHAARQTMIQLLHNPLLYHVRYLRKQIRWIYPSRFP